MRDGGRKKIKRKGRKMQEGGREDGRGWRWRKEEGREKKP